MKRTATLSLLLLAFFCLPMNAERWEKNNGEVTEAEMQTVYEEVKTPFKHDMVITPQDENHLCDCPTVFRKGKKWMMTYVVYNGRGSQIGRGYETWLAESDDLLHWHTTGRVLSYHNGYCDENQRAGFPALVVDITDDDAGWWEKLKGNPVVRNFRTTGSRCVLQTKVTSIKVK